MIKDFAIAIVHFGNPVITKNCVNSILDFGGFAPEILIVDNSSNLELNLPSVTVLKPGKNLGFGAGVNLAIKALEKKGFEKFLVVNNDVIFPEKFCERLFEFLSSAPIETSILTFQIKRFPETQRVWFNGGYIDWLRLEGAHRDFNKRECEIKRRDFGEVDFFTGAAFFVTASVFKKIGGFDEKFFLYYEDLDFSLKAKHCGVKILFHPELKLFHRVSAGALKGKKSVLKFENEVYYSRIKNKLIIIKRYAKGISFFTSSVSVSAKILKYFAMFLFTMQFESIKFLVKAIIGGLNEG